MTKNEMHYLNCQDSNCERFACVARRDLTAQIAEKQADLDALIEGLRKAILWAENVSARVSTEEKTALNWTYLNEARKVYREIEEKYK